MRTSSIKTIVAALSISCTVLAAAPSSYAGPAPTKKSQTTRVEAPENDRLAGVRELINRALRRVGIQTGGSIPIPDKVGDD